jgi:hypothetical protein
VYFGKVVDENGNPIPGVKVSYNGNALNETGNDVIRNAGSVTTDSRGIFKIDGIRGIGLMVELSHPNYYPYPENSTGFDKRSPPRSGYFSDAEDKAELFRMHIKGMPVPLIERHGGADVPLDGSPTKVSLFGETRQQQVAQLEIQAWTNPPSENAERRCDWRVLLSVPGGGITESTNYFDFVAPDTGYLEHASIEVSGSESARNAFFVRTPNAFIRLRTHFIAGQNLFATFDYFLNPDGSRNLESDDSRIIHPTQ